MPNFKYTMIFQYSSGINDANSTPVRTGGWSESYYASANTQQIYDAFKVLIQKRLGICPRGTSVIRIRTQQVDPAGPATLNRVNYAAPSTWLSDVPQMALKIPFFLDADQTSIIREFRGIPDVQVTVGEYTPTTPFTAALAVFLAELTNGTWKAKRRNKAAVQWAINSISVAGSVVMIQPTAGLVQGTQVQVIRTLNQQTGRRFGYFARVQAHTDDSNFTIAGPKVKASGFGTLRVASSIYNGFQNPQFGSVEIVTRKVGRPFRAYSGRASRRT